MKTLIAYASKTGTTERCARKLAALIGGADLADLTKIKPDPATYDLVVVGGSIRMGTLHKAARDFLLAHQDRLEEKRAAYFICNGFLHQAEEFLEKNIPAPLRQKALAVDSFGGEMDLGRQRGMDKMIVKMAAKSDAAQKNPPPKILEDRIEAFAAKLR